MKSKSNNFACKPWNLKRVKRRFAINHMLTFLIPGTSINSLDECHKIDKATSAIATDSLRWQKSKLYEKLPFLISLQALWPNFRDCNQLRRMARYLRRTTGYTASLPLSRQTVLNVRKKASKDRNQHLLPMQTSPDFGLLRAGKLQNTVLWIRHLARITSYRTLNNSS